MKKTFNCSTIINKEVPISAIWEFIDGRFTAEIPGSDTIDWSSMSWYRKNGTTPQEAIRESGYFQHLSDDEMIERMIQVIIGNPPWLESANYYDTFLKGFGVPRNFTKVLSNDVQIAFILPMLLLAQMEPIVNLIAFNWYLRDPQTTDYDYNVMFNYGYQWEWIQINLLNLVYEKENGEIRDALKLLRQEDTMFYRDEFGTNRTVSSYYPTKCDLDLKKGDSLWTDCNFMLNGYYWTRRQLTVTAIWKRNSYCYLSNYISFKFKIFRDPTTGNLKHEIYDNNYNRMDATQLTNYLIQQYNANATNVGDDYGSTYSTNDIPYNYRIWR